MKHEEIVKAFNQAYIIHKELQKTPVSDLQLILFRFMGAEQYEAILFDVFAWYKAAARKVKEGNWECILHEGKQIYEHYQESEFCQVLISYFLKVLEEIE
ncbi:hypothetical protein NDGK_02948 [Clostridiales bacterium CHKCI001]|nr:hypothetical protein NDGK_02948 [Clostridiales bacterium CHKCI001]